MKVKVKIIREELTVKFAEVDLGDDFILTDDPRTNSHQVKQFVEKKMIDDIDFRDRNFECVSSNDEVEVTEWIGKEE